jgi:alkanesulfonate monooxygenase SsuD/methylene tetrahydromethanopterin reductase-like flavin-dependent oxidoreductase (luciferase family)
MLAALAAVRTRIRLVTRCAPVGHRNPAHLAKIEAGIDLISREQLRLGNDGADEQHLAPEDLRCRHRERNQASLHVYR